MAAFHKPKVYRSLEGCCICKAKSSSSRFTASAKYELYFESCFRISPTTTNTEGEEERRGDEICNACVLLVKRYRKLPAGSGRHWAHVVDARAGPGVKNFVKLRRRESLRERVTGSREYAKKHVWRRRKPERKVEDTPAPDEGWPRSTPEELPSGFLDPEVWSRREACCGPVFVSVYGEAVVDTRFLSLPCKHGRPRPRTSILPPILPSSTLLASTSSPSPSTSSAPISPSTCSSSSSSSTAPFFSIERIIESELQSFQRDEVEQRNKTKEEETIEESPPDPDADEGFFDKPSVSPVSILSTSSVLSTSSISSIETEVEVKLGVELQAVA